MEETIVIAGIEVPKADWDRTPGSIQMVVRHLERRLAELERRLAEVEERLALTSQNSSKPPSSDPPEAQAPAGKPKKSRKRRGGQPGHRGFGFHLYPPERCQEIIDHKPGDCRYCHHPLSGEDPNPERYQRVELPPPVPEIVEHRRHNLQCPACGRRTKAAWPKALAGPRYGPRLRAVVGLLSGVYRQSHRQVQGLLSDLWGLHLSTGSVNRMRQELSQSLAASEAQVRAYVRTSARAGADETGWPQHDGDGGNPEGRRGWLWTAVCELATLFQVTLDRSQRSARALLGENYGGVVTCDRYGAYNWLSPEQRQLCWAHLQRDFQRMAERAGAAGEVGRQLVVRARRLFRWWHRWRDGTLSQAQFQQAMARLRQGLREQLEEAVALGTARGEKTLLAKTVRTCAQILKQELSLWRFLEVEGVEPTNNASERALRGAVIWRRLSLGSQSEAGSEFVARILTVVTTLKQQGRPVLEFLEQALQGIPPSMLPDPL